MRMERPDFQFRFAVGDPEHNYSTIWSAWGWGNEFYFGAVAMLGFTKISLHQTGECQVAIIKDKWEKLGREGLPRPDDRALTKWVQKPTPDSGAIHVASVLFPTDYLKSTKVPEGTAKRPLTILTPAPPGKAVEVSYFYSREPAETLGPKFAKLCIPLFRVTLDNGDSVSIVVRQTEFDKRFLPPPEQMQRLSDTTNVEIPPGTETPNLTAAVWNDPVENGFGTLIVAEIGGVTLRRNS
jgi:hypothetical protein